MPGVLGAQEVHVLAEFCEQIVPGSAKVGSVRYVERAVDGMSQPDEDAVRAAIGLVSTHLQAGQLGMLIGTQAFQLLRCLAIDAYYGSCGQPSHDLPVNSDVDSADVVVVGSRLVAAMLGERGRDVLLLEAGGFHLRVAGEQDEPVALAGVDTRVAIRAASFDVAKFHRQTGLLGPSGDPFTLGDLEPWYARVEGMLGVRERDWTPSVHRVNRGFRALGAPLEPVRSYPDLGARALRVRPGCTVERLLISGCRVRGVVCRVPDGTTTIIRASVVVLAGGSLNTPQILLRTPEYVALDTPSTRLTGRTLALRPARLVYGLFDELQECHPDYPVTAYMHDREGGFVVEATTIQEPVSFASNLLDAYGGPLYGQPLVDAVRAYRYWAGLLVTVNDRDTGTVELDAAGSAVITKQFAATERRRLSGALKFAVAALEAAGARQVIWSGLSTSHVQGSARMGSDPGRSVVDARGQSHDIAGLYIADGSVVPVSLSVNPALTIMALAAMVTSGLAQGIA